MAGGGVRRRGMITEINVTPLVDIMLVLLIIFMLTAHLIAKQGLEVELPHASQATAVKPQTLAVTITRDGALYLDDKPTNGAALRTAVAAAAKADKNAQVIIAGDKGVSYGRVVWVLDLVRAAGITAFTIQIDPTQMVPPT